MLHAHHIRERAAAEVEKDWVVVRPVVPNLEAHIDGSRASTSRENELSRPARVEVVVPLLRASKRRQLTQALDHPQLWIGRAKCTLILRLDPSCTHPFKTGGQWRQARWCG